MKANGTLPGLPEAQQWKAARTDRSDLMPCSFCGGPPSLITWTHSVWASKFQIQCANAECSAIAGTQRMKSFEEAVSVWTNRPTITKVEAHELLAALDDEEFHKA